MGRPLKADVWVLKARLQCAGCEDVTEVRKDTSFATFLDAVDAFSKRHEKCQRQGTLPEAEE